MRSVRVVPISKGGQISLPAEVRRRWETDRVIIGDRGDYLVIQPMPDDPIDAVRGSIKTKPGFTFEDYKREQREDDAREELRLYGRVQNGTNWAE